jgi:acetyl esterase/lipase
MTRLQFIAAASFVVLALVASRRLHIIPDYHEVLLRERPQVAHKLPYGPAPDQFGELWLPTSRGPHPVIIMIHGGCWQEVMPGADLMAYLSEDLRRDGIAVWNLEYRRLGVDGGGYPGTFRDLAAATDYLRQIKKRYALDLSRVVTVGHSAGGHLALWVAARKVLKDGPLYRKNPLPVHAAVSLAGINDLAAYRIDGPACGGPGTIDAVSGGEARYTETSPAAMLPLHVPQIIFSGAKDDIVPQRFGDAYGAAAKAAGDRVEIINIEGAGHMDFIDPDSGAWKQVKAVLKAYLKQDG